MNYKFNRQKPLDRYIVDFYCKPLNLVIEIDGSYHLETQQRIKDEQRQKILEKMGLNFLRFSEQQVRKDMDVVVKTIEDYIAGRALISLILTPIVGMSKLPLCKRESGHSDYQYFVRGIRSTRTRC